MASGGKKMNFTEKNNKGIANELEFAKKIDKKMVKELDKPFYELITNLFDNL